MERGKPCVGCGYDITGIAGRCPECGAPAFDEREVFDGTGVRDHRKRWLHLGAALAAIGLLVFMLSRCHF